MAPCRRPSAAHILLWADLPGLPISAVFDFPSLSCGECVLQFSYQSFSVLSMGFLRGMAPSASTPGSGVDGDCAVAIRCSLQYGYLQYGYLQYGYSMGLQYGTLFFLPCEYTSFFLHFYVLALQEKTSSLITRHEHFKMCRDFFNFQNSEKRKGPLKRYCSKGPC